MSISASATLAILVFAVVLTASSSAAVVFTSGSSIGIEVPEGFVQYDAPRAETNTVTYRRADGSQIALREVLSISDEHRTGFLNGLTDGMAKKGFQQVSRSQYRSGRIAGDLVEGKWAGPPPYASWVLSFQAPRRAISVVITLAGFAEDSDVHAQAEQILESVQAREPPALAGERTALAFIFEEMEDLRLLSATGGVAELWSSRHAMMRMELRGPEQSTRDMTLAVLAEHILNDEFARSARMVVSPPTSLPIAGADAIEVRADIFNASGRSTLNAVVWVAAFPSGSTLRLFGVVRPPYADATWPAFEKVRDSIRLRRP